ncbi:MAG: hypothetical protein E7565_09640 [Ruminococcaceae bacterium]|nr:hypothetical protein [Oscillospiraceae bacterium]
MLRIMTHNVWNKDENSPSWEQKGLDCSAKARLSGLLRVYKEILPDVVGGQEVSALMLSLLKENTNYRFLEGNYTPIFYNPDKVESVESYFELYPERIEGYEGTFNDSKSKAFNIAVLKEKSSGKHFIFANTHLWWKVSDESKRGTHSYQEHSDEARVLQIRRLIEKAEEFIIKYNCSIIVAGDLNTDYNSEVLKQLFKNGYKHTHDIATKTVDETMGLHYCYPDGFENFYYDKPFECAIDHILLKGEGEVENFNRYSPEYYLPVSDHSPAYIDIKL